MRFGGRVAVITGGGSGIGKATAHLMAAEGGQLALIDLNSQAMSAVALFLASDDAAFVSGQTIEVTGGR